MAKVQPARFFFEERRNERIDRSQRERRRDRHANTTLKRVTKLGDFEHIEKQGDDAYDDEFR